MLTLEQRRVRQTALGSSDVAAVLGINLYGLTRHDIYASKIVPVEQQKDEHTVSMRIGDALEPLCRELAGEALGRHIAGPGYFQCEKYPWLAASLDGQVFKEDGTVFDRPLECKAVINPAKAWEWGEDGDKIPDGFIVQATVQMIVRDTRSTAVSAIIQGEHKMFEVEWNDDLVGMLLSETEKFWKEHVLAKKPPAPDGSDGASRMLKAIFKHDSPVMLMASAPLEVAATRYREAHKMIKEAEAVKEFAKQELEMAIGNAEGLLGAGWKATWKANKNGVRSFRMG